jgi:two-component system, sensor histidine kinase and response regulator
VRDLPGLADTLMTEGEQGDRESAARQAHSIKGLAATLGQDRLAGFAADAERSILAAPQFAGDAASINYLQGAVDAAVGPLSRLADALQPESLAAPGSSIPTTGSSWPHEARADLQALAACLRESDMEALGQVDRLRARMAPALGEPWQALEDAVQALDFEAALAACDELLEDARWATPA